MSTETETLDLLTQIRDHLANLSSRRDLEDLHTEVLTEVRKLTAVAEDFGKFASGPMASSPLLKMLGIGK